MSVRNYFPNWSTVEWGKICGISQTLGRILRSSTCTNVQTYVMFNACKRSLLRLWKRGGLWCYKRLNFFVPIHHSHFPLAVKSHFPVVSQFTHPFGNFDNCWTFSHPEYAWNICHLTLSNQPTINQSILLSYFNWITWTVGYNWNRFVIISWLVKEMYKDLSVNIKIH